MPHNYTRTDQVKFLIEWFDSWSEMQREDFLPIMTQALNPGDHVNGLVGGVNTLRVGERRPSLFDCQVKLFQDWYENWIPEERERLLQHFSNSDPEFSAKLQKTMPAEHVSNNTPTSAPQPSPIDDDNKDDGVSPGSHSSSPLSSLSQPLSPHDSGLEENHSDLEAAPSLDAITEASGEANNCDIHAESLSEERKNEVSEEGVEAKPPNKESEENHSPSKLTCDIQKEI